MDEWTLSQNMAADTANGGLNQLEEHYKTFIVSIIFVTLRWTALGHVKLTFLLSTD